MSKIAQRMRTGQRVNPSMPVPTSGMPTTTYGGNGGGCGPSQPVVPQSWGAACPPGGCTAPELAAALDRSFAGERYGCREITYWRNGTADANGRVVIQENATVTICPTRIILFLRATEHSGIFVSAFTIGNQNQLVGDGLPYFAVTPFSYQIIPYVTDCIRAGIPWSMTIDGLNVGEIIDVGLVGPAIG